jgi:hypothetical protein
MTASFPLSAMSKADSLPTGQMSFVAASLSSLYAYQLLSAMRVQQTPPFFGLICTLLIAATIPPSQHV